ncbi:cysteine hydrolase family protein [Pseudoneobacillus sp. C159]
MPENTALIIIDVQKAFNDSSWGRRNNPEAETNIVRILDKWRATRRPVIHIQHVHTSPSKEQSLFHISRETHRFKEMIEPLNGEPILRKNVNSSFIGTDLEERLRENGIDSVVVVGLTTNHCVETTTRMAGNLGFNAYLVSDATATFDRIGPDGKLYFAEDIHQMTMVNLNQEFATIVDTNVLLELA